MRGASWVGLGGFRAYCIRQEPTVTDLTSSRFIPPPPMHPSHRCKHKSVQATYFLKIFPGLALSLLLRCCSLRLQPLCSIPAHILQHPWHAPLPHSHCGPLHSSKSLHKGLEGPVLQADSYVNCKSQLKCHLFSEAFSDPSLSLP